MARLVSVFRSRRLDPRSTVAPLLSLAIALVATLMIISPAFADGGAWTQVGLAGKQTSSVAVDPANPDVLLAGTLGSGVYRSVDRGKTWKQANTGLKNLYVNAVVFDPKNSSIAYAGAGRSIAMGDEEGGLYRSTDGGKTWTRKFEGHVFGIAIYPPNPSIVYTGGFPIAKSTDRGLTWKNVGPTEGWNIDPAAVAVDPTNANLVLVGGPTEGGTGLIFRSTDGGASWKQVWMPSESQMTEATAVDELALNSTGGTVLAATHSLLLRSTNDGTSWVTALYDGRFLAVLTNPNDSSEVFVGTGAGNVWRSTSTGVTFDKLDSSPGKQVNGLALDRANPATLYAATSSGVFAFKLAALPQVLPKTGGLPIGEALPVLLGLGAAIALLGLRLRPR